VLDVVNAAHQAQRNHSMSRRDYLCVNLMVSVALGLALLSARASAQTEARLSTNPVANSPSPVRAASGEDPGGADPASLFFSQGKYFVGFGARVIGGWEYQATERDPAQVAAGLRSNEFGWFLSQARFTVDGGWSKRVSVQLDLDFSDEDDPLRDAWLNLRVARELQLRLGQFKRPFSRLELRGAGKLPLRSRGLANDHLVGDLGWGGRSLGSELWGKVRALNLEWSVSATNPPPRHDGADLHARLAYSPSAWLEVGAGGAHKIIENSQTSAPDFIAGNAAGVDLRVKVGPLYVLVDALLGENLGSQGLLEPDPRAVRNNAASVGGYATWRIDLPANWELEPTAFGEWVDSNLEYSRSETLRFVVGVNALFHEELFRAMPQVELVRPLRSSPDALWSARETFYLMFSAQL
jgi:Phosphate-selective porin O and P